MGTGQFNVLAKDKDSLEEEHKSYHKLYPPIRQYIQAPDAVDRVLETLDKFALKCDIPKLL